MADEPWVASARVEMPRPLVETAELVTQGHQLDDAGVQLARSPSDQVGNEVARRFAPVSKGDDLADLAEAQADGLGGPDEAKALEGILFVEAIARIAPLGGAQHADAVVVAPQGRWEGAKHSCSGSSTGGGAGEGG